jgi:hypothetical protein
MELGSTLRDEEGWSVTEKRMLRRIFCLRGRERQEDESWRKVHKEEFQTLYFQKIFSPCPNKEG